MKLKNIEGLLRFGSTYDISLSKLGEREIEIDVERIQRILYRNNICVSNKNQRIEIAQAIAGADIFKVKK